MSISVRIVLLLLTAAPSFAADTSCRSNADCVQPCFTGSCDGICYFTPVVCAVGECNPDTGLCPAVCGNGVVEAGEQCDPGSPSIDGRGVGGDACCNPTTCQYEPAGTGCGPDSQCNQCNGAGACLALSGSCDDGLQCTSNDSCDDGLCIGQQIDCTNGNICVTGSCTEGVGCTTQPNQDANGQPCQADYCNTGGVCSNGSCQGAQAVNCNDSSDCTADWCDPTSGCVNDVVVESPACGSCADGVDNDDNNSIDAEDCACATLCAQQRYAIVVTAASGPRKHRLYTGSNVLVDNADGTVPFSQAPYPVGPSSAGVCTTSGEFRAGSSFGSLAVKDIGESKWGQGTTGFRNTEVRTQFDSGNGPEKLKDVAPYVGPGTCSNNAAVCGSDSDCGAGNTCDNRLRLNAIGNTHVDRSGSSENYLRCLNAISTVPAEGVFVSALAGNVAGYTDGTQQIKTSAAVPNVTISVGHGQQVINAKRIVIAGGTTLTLDGFADTVLVIQVQRSLRLGGEAKVVLTGGLTADHVLWNMVGTHGRPKLLRSSQFAGTILAAERKGCGVGGGVILSGALKCQKAHISQAAVINHVPFTALLQ